MRDSAQTRFTYLHILGANQLYNHCRCATYLSFFSSAVPTGSGAFQMPTCPSLSSAAASTLGGGGGGRNNLRNTSVTFSLFWHEASLG